MTEQPIYKRIRSCIEERGLTLRSVAAKSGINEKRFYPIMSGKKVLTADEAEAICTKGLGLESNFFGEKFSVTENMSNESIRQCRIDVNTECNILPNTEG